MKIAIISDTHNMIRKEVVEKIQGCDYILHSGDISSQAVLDHLASIAPIKAVRGNNDKEWAEQLPNYLDFELGGLRFYMTHKKKDLPTDLSPYDIVIFGHTHQYMNTWIDFSDAHRRLLLNPGSCGPRRFYDAITMAILTIETDGWMVERIEIPHKKKEVLHKVEATDIRRVIEIVVNETQKNRSVEVISRRHKLDPLIVEKIVRLYVTHPGVSVEGIMKKMGY